MRAFRRDWCASEQTGEISPLTIVEGRGPAIASGVNKKNVVGTFTTNRQDFALCTCDGVSVLTITDTTTGEAAAVSDFLCTAPHCGVAREPPEAVAREAAFLATHYELLANALWRGV